MAREILEKVTMKCPICRETHEIEVVQEVKSTYLKGELAVCLLREHYCSNAYDTFETEEDKVLNEASMKDAVRKSRGLLTASEIVAIRKQYGASQSGLAMLLGWGDRTIARYESSLIQDRGNNIVLKKIAKDPEWFLELLEDAKDKIPESKYRKMKKSAEKLLKEKAAEE